MKLDKISLSKFGLDGILKQGYKKFKDFDTYAYLKLYSPILIRSNEEFFYVEFNDEVNFNKENINFASKEENVIISSKFCALFKNIDKKVDVYYKERIEEMDKFGFHNDIEEFIEKIDTYYTGYDKRYQKVYESGGTTWESLEPNKSLLEIYNNFPDYFFNKKVIDLGCGEGRDSIFLAENNVNVLGVDISNVALNKARKLSNDRNLLVEFVEANVINLNAIPNNSFDTALNMGCLHMLTGLQERRKHIENVYRILKNEGIFIVDHCKKDWGKGFFSIPTYNKDNMLVGNFIDRKIRIENGEKLISLEVIPYLEKDSVLLSNEICELGFKELHRLDTNTQAFGFSTLLIFQKDK